VWTPKRILILIAGTFLFLAGFAVYDYFLGGYDGLPPLPEDCLPIAGDRPFVPVDPKDPECDKKMRIAFDVASEEARRKLILDSTTRNMLLAVDQFDIEDDGRVKLSPFSVALFPKKKGNAGAYPEVNTIQCEVAFLTLDQPIKNFTEMSNRRIIGIELRGAKGVTIINNRHTPAKNDDVEVNIKGAPVYYAEATNKIWSEGFVRLLDTAPQPNPTEVTARGMELQLAKENAATRGKGGAAAKKGDGVTGVEYLLLKSNVEMHLYMDGKTGFLVGGPEAAAKAAPSPKAGEPGEKAHIMVQTAGSMFYDLTKEKEQAQFDAPPGAAGGPGEPVRVTREHRLGPDDRKFDQLTCDSLLLTFRKKTPQEISQKAGDDDARDPFDGGKEIESALALARPGREVILTMDTENMEAFGAELFYACATNVAGPRTILKGTPMHAIRDGNILEALELHLFGPDKNGNGQQAFAKGPGKIDLLDKALDLGYSNSNSKNSDDADAESNADSKPGGPKGDGKLRHTLHAIWRDNLISTKDKDGDKVYDLLTLTGDAKFIDDEHNQWLAGQRLQVWFEPNNGPAGNQQQADGAARQKPHRVEAFERVTAQSPEMQIERAHKVTVVFKEAAASDDQLPAGPTALPAALTPAGAPGGDPGAKTAPPKVVGQPTSSGGNAPKIELKPPVPELKPLPEVTTPGNPPGQRNPVFNMPGSSRTESKEQPKKPFRLSADEIVAFVTTLGTKKQLQELVAEGDVRVLQDGETPKDKGVDIIGDMLNLIYHPLGNRLWVLGTRRSAQLQMGELTLVGPKVDIDQKDNTAAVDGIGLMKMPSNTSFDGGTPAKEGAIITIHWNKDMLFNGKFAEFHGGVLAYQDNARLKCQTMQVTLDRFVSFKEGQKDKENAKVEKLVCDQKVWVEDESLSPEGKRLAYKRLTASALDMDNPEGRMIAPGPGQTIYIAQSGDDLNTVGSPAAAQKKEAANPKQAQKLTTTIVKFDGRMFGSQKQGGPRIAIFYDNVEVHHQPGDDPDVKVDADNPPKDGFYMRCNNLNVSTIEREGKSFQYMVAKNSAFFRTPEFYGNADVIKYDQSQELVIFEGDNGNTTKLYKFRERGAKPQLIEGRKILYNRKTGTFTLDGGKVISSWLRPGEADDDRDVARATPTGKRRASIVAGFDLDGQHEEFLGLGLIARDDRQVFAAHGAIDDLALFRRGDGETDFVLFVGAVFNDDLGGHFVH